MRLQRSEGSWPAEGEPLTSWSYQPHMNTSWLPAGAAARLDSGPVRASLDRQNWMSSMVSASTPACSPPCQLKQGEMDAPSETIQVQTQPLS